MPFEPYIHSIYSGNYGSKAEDVYSRLEVAWSFSRASLGQDSLLLKDTRLARSVPQVDRNQWSWHKQSSSLEREVALDWQLQKRSLSRDMLCMEASTIKVNHKLFVQQAKSIQFEKSFWTLPTTLL